MLDTRAAEYPAVTHVRRVASSAVIEIHLCARPGSGAYTITDQAHSMYEHLLADLLAEGAAPSDIVAEKVFCSDIASQRAPIVAARAAVLRQRSRDLLSEPAVTFIEQPPVWPGQLCEVQAFALLPAGGSTIRTIALQEPLSSVTGKVLQIAGVRHVFISGITAGKPGDGATFPRQAADVFTSADRFLRRAGFTFHDVVRTWIYVRDIDRHYAHLNRARREFFSSYGVRRLPASTGIHGGSFSPDRGCMLDLRAISVDGRSIRTLHSPTMNEAPVYGADFARGVAVDLPDRRIIYISGTASIDHTGQVVCPGDIEGQVDRMLLNVERLLASEGAGYSDLVSAVTYLKRAEYRHAFRDVSRRRGFLDRIPNTLCVADVCRPEWLCELEAIAVVA